MSVGGSREMDMPDRIVSRDECRRLIDRICTFARGGGTTAVTIDSWWAGELRWARNHVTLASDRRNITVAIERVVNGTVGTARTNQLDDISLEGTVRAAERMGEIQPTVVVTDFTLPPPTLPTPSPVLWSDATYNATATVRGDLVSILTQRAAARDMLSAGFLRMYGCAQAIGPNPSGVVRYQTYTIGECSLTVRHPQGISSGWAGQSSYDWAAIDGFALAERAIEKCIASVNPVAAEPGRYTALLEPQAVYDLVRILVDATDRAAAERGEGPFTSQFDESLGLYRTKLGLRVVDERISISHDPMDAQLGIVPQPGLMPITWIDHGVLSTLTNLRESHALPRLNENLASLYRQSFRMTGGEASVDQMIATTQRGLYVTRFSSVRLLDESSLLCTGVTRDGLWLVEHGKRTKAVKNMRFRESPLSVLNNVDQMSASVPIFSAFRDVLASAIVPSIKVRDFRFTSYVDAI